MRIGGTSLNLAPILNKIRMFWLLNCHSFLILSPFLYLFLDLFSSPLPPSLPPFLSVTLPLSHQVIREWRSVGGVLLLGYEMYRLLSLSVPSLGGNKMAIKKKKSLVVKAPAGGTIDLDETEREMEALIGE